MAKENSFDIVSKTDYAELTNALNQTEKEVSQRFDFKGSKAKVEMQAKAAVFGRGAAVGAAAGAFVLGALVLIMHGVAWLLWYLLFPSDQFFWGFFLEAVLLLILGAIAGFVAYKALQKAQSPVPDQAIAAARETQATIQGETTLMKEQVREVVVKPEDQRP